MWHTYNWPPRYNNNNSIIYVTFETRESKRLTHKPLKYRRGRAN